MVAFIASFIIGCIDEQVDKVVKTLDKAINTLETQSISWQHVLESTSEELLKEGQSTISNEISNVLTKTISDTRVEASCYTDFLRNRVKEDLIRIRSRYTKEKLNLTPVFCTPNPGNIDYSLVKEGRLKSIDISGYNLDFANENIKVSLIDKEEYDVTYALANPTRYLITLNLGSNGVPLTVNSQKLIFKLSDDEIRSVNIIQTHYAPLEFQWTREFERIWDDKGSGAKRDIAFFRPIVPSGFKILGHFAYGSYGNPDQKRKIMVVRESNKNGSSNLLANPIRYERIWYDRGSGAKKDGAVWRPIPPKGYSAIGDVATRGWRSPSTGEIVCVRNDLVEKGVVGHNIWNDRGSGAKHDVSIWSISSKDNKKGLNGNFFQANGKYRSPNNTLPVIKRSAIRPVKTDQRQL
jgi:hypothetical protein